VSGSRLIIALLLFVSLFSVSSEVAQDKGSEKTGAKSGDQSLELTRHGEVRLFDGRRGAFKSYAAPDGTEGSLVYGQFQSVPDADRQVQQWLKAAQKVTSREQKRDNKGLVIGVRIVAIAIDGKSGKKWFLIIRRDDVDCYLVQSLSLSVAMQVEDMIQDK
jgi:hypothetical protein